MVGSGVLALLMLATMDVQGQEPLELSVCTFNVRYDNPSDTITWAERQKEVAQAVKYFDIVGIQEALPNQYKDLSRLMPKHNAYGVGRDADGGGEACPIFWNSERFDFLTGETRWLSMSPKEAGSVGWDADLPRIATLVVLFDRERQHTVRVVNSHWSHVGEEARKNAAALLAGWSGWEEENEGDLVLVCGDFNAEPESAALQSLEEAAALTDTYDVAKYRCRKSLATYATFLPENLANATRIDYILFRGPASVEWVCADEIIKYGVYISDHMPYHAIFK